MLRSLVWLIAGVSGMLLISANGSADTSVFGPITYQSVRGQPEEWTSTFTADVADTCDGKARFLARVETPAASGERAARTAFIALNGISIFTQADFESGASHFERPVTVSPANELRVSIGGGASGSSLAISIIRLIEEDVALPNSYIASPVVRERVFDVGDTDSVFVISIMNGTSDGRHRVTSGRVALNDAEIVAPAELAGGTPSLHKTIIMRPHNVMAVSCHGPADSQMTVSVRRVLDESACGPRIHIDTPTDGMVVTAVPLVVTGTISARSPDVGVSVNGRVADIDLTHAGTLSDPYRWIVSSDSVGSGTVTLHANAQDSRGRTSAHSVTIQYLPMPSALVLQTSRASGIAPLDVYLTLTEPEGAPLIPVVGLEVDTDGDGVFERQEGGRADVHVLYEQPGMYIPTVRAIDANGEVNTASTSVIVQSKFAIHGVIVGRIRSLKRALVSNDAESALTLFSDRAKPKFRAAFAAIGSRLSSIADSLPDNPGVVTLTPYFAEYVLFRTEENQRHAYFLTMVRDGHGIWRIDDF